MLARTYGGSFLFIFFSRPVFQFVPFRDRRSRRDSFVTLAGQPPAIGNWKDDVVDTELKSLFRVGCDQEREKERERDVVRENKIGEMWGRLIWKAAATIKSSSWLSPLIYRARRLWTLPPLHALHTPHNHIQSHPCIHPITSLDRKIPPKIFKSNLSIIFFYWIQ